MNLEIFGNFDVAMTTCVVNIFFNLSTMCAGNACKKICIYTSIYYMSLAILRSNTFSFASLRKTNEMKLQH